ncbi:MAG: isochorismate synthase [Actinomycetota bacterium]
MKSITTRLDADLDPEELGAATGMLWSHQGTCFAGLGEAMRIPVGCIGEASSMREAQEQLALLAGPDDLDRPGSGPVAFAAMPFDRTAAGELVVPRTVVASGPEGRRWITVVSDGSGTVDDAVAEAVDVLAETAAADPDRLTMRSVLAPDVWRDQIVAAARDRIRAGDLTKAVLARELVLEASAPIDQGAVLQRLLRAHPSATVFALDGFVGASPETLVSRIDDVVRAHPLAGTTPRATDPAGDQRAAAALLASSKDRWEHRITIDWLLDELLPFCSYVDAEPEPTVVSLPNVHHLGTRVEGRLSAPPASVLELVAALHPTPAVAGDPQQDALALIESLERAERGRYAGPTGWVDADGNGSFVVAIRSAQIDGATARLFAGVGVVGDSDPQSELDETRAKFQAMLPALLRL